MDLQQLIVERIRLADRNGAGKLLEEWAEVNGYDRLLSEVLEPMMVVIGDEWCNSESYSLAQAYVAAKVVEDILIKIAAFRQSKMETVPTKGNVVIGNIEDLLARRIEESANLPWADLIAKRGVRGFDPAMEPELVARRVAYFFKESSEA